jgi:phosphate transport system substrate-binding protein
MSSSGAGIADTQNGLNDFGMSSRELKDSEGGVSGRVLCFDGVALVTGVNSSAENITVQEVKGLFSDGVPTEDNSIVAGIGRDSGSGTRSAFDELMGISGEYHSSISTLAETGNVIEALAGTVGSVGYISYGSLSDRVKALSLDGVACTAENIKNKTYALQRPFVIVTSQNRPLSAAAQGFYDYIFSSSALSVIERLHYVPV